MKIKKSLAAAMLALGYVLTSGASLVLVGATPFLLIGCERDSDLEDAAEDVGSEIEDAGDEIEDKID